MFQFIVATVFVGSLALIGIRRPRGTLMVNDLRLDSLHKGRVMQKAFLCHNLIMMGSNYTKECMVKTQNPY